MERLKWPRLLPLSLSLPLSLWICLPTKCFQTALLQLLLAGSIGSAWKPTVRLLEAGLETDLPLNSLWGLVAAIIRVPCTPLSFYHISVLWLAFTFQYLHL